MAIKPCKECGSQISDKAESCPQCGAKQPKKTSKLALIFAGLVLLAILIGILGDNKTSQGQVGQNPTQAAEQPPQTQNWQYNTSKDEMRGIESKFAATVSTNTVNFDFPYNGGSKLGLTLRKRGSEIDVMISVTKGQFLCGIRSCEAAFKFDDGTVQSITMVEPDSHSPDLLFVAYDKTENKIINQLKSSKKLIIEVPFYQEGTKQFTFDVSGLEWD
ncbi:MULTISPECIES: hypothetical protein [Acinetobacter]|uniref:hypothetical protein n=1 Tax=Acinetobacter TaxID=469 RepID=UPI00144474C0|nr:MULTISPECIES: hypothetical protein [Acinetobacter]